MTSFAASAGSSLLKMLYSSLLAGVAIAVVFSIAIFGVTRSTDMRHANRGGAATAYAAVAVVALLLSVAIVVYGLILVTNKS